jgi:hypothetical protein
MKTLLIVCLALTLACAMLVPQAIAGNKVKVDVCHVLAVNDTIPNFLDTEMTIYYGKVINVSENAVYSHLEHGDSTAFFSGEGTEASVETFRAAGGHVPAANCHFGLWPDGTLAAPAQ